MAQADTREGRWQRVLIVGGPGSGKTTLAKSIAGAIGAPSYELDAIGWEGGAGRERSLEDRLRDANPIAGQEAWVAEGSFVGWTNALAAAADVIVWLDVPWRVARWRIVTRHVKASLTRSNRHPGLRKLWRFVQDSKGYYTGRDPSAGRLQTAAWLEGFGSKVAICRTDREVEEVARDAGSG